MIFRMTTPLLPVGRSRPAVLDIPRYRDPVPSRSATSATVPFRAIRTRYHAYLVRVT